MQPGQSIARWAFSGRVLISRPQCSQAKQSTSYAPPAWWFGTGSVQSIAAGGFRVGAAAGGPRGGSTQVDHLVAVVVAAGQLGRLERELVAFDEVASRFAVEVDALEQADDGAAVGLFVFARRGVLVGDERN